MAEEKDTIKADQQETADIPKDQENAAEAAETAQAEEQDPAEENVKEAEAVQPDTQEGEEKKEKFSKRKEKKEKRDKKDEKIEELSDQVKRQMAEFDNYRKRTEKEKSHMYEIGAKEVIEKILPVVDNFERGLASVPETERDDPFVEGMNKIYKQLMTTLDEIGVKPIEAVGGEFDPNLHNAVMHVEDEAFGDNIVAEEFQKGYLYKESVVRHSMVKVAN
ncbi:nucleotide exchange factor GrpE [Diplocloster agilis]|uniref:nucleotide exchange factor GrpE n=1 Tax=Diplocloster agilis TaxID=2850323 RepID=UPI001EE9073B|nr:nucleotide exchange factor GrpE [Diplocloster agilis]